MLKNKKMLFLLLVFVVIVLAAGGFLFWRNHTTAQHSVAIKSVKTPVLKLPTPTNETAKSDRQLASTAPTLTQGAATDTHGTDVSNSAPSTWTVSTSGDITVKSPAANATLSPGTVLSGSSSLATIEYRLIDDQVGVIAQGPLTVTGGDFSGTLNFSSKAQTGRLDVFSYATNGSEINEVQIPIKFSE